MRRFGAAVRNLRARLRISQEELANRADLHRTYIAGVEGGSRNITLKSIEKLARALEVSIPELLSVSTRVPPPPPNDLSSKLAEILLIEDESDDVALTLSAFREARIANPVHVAMDGAEALDYLFGMGQHAARRLPQVILLDLNLPKVDGLEVLRRIKADPRTKDIPVIVLTGSRQSSDVIASQRLGAINYIVKPVDFHNFSRVTPHLSLEWGLFGPCD